MTSVTLFIIYIYPFMCIISDAGVVNPQKSKMSFGTEHFRGQKYSKLKKDFLKKGELFVDPEFPANNKSLFFSKVDNDIEWKRPNVSWVELS